MGTHLIPRDVKGEGRILLIFTQKGFFYTLIGLGVGAVAHTILSMFGAELIGWIVLALLALIGFTIGQVRVPESNAFDILKKTGGENIDEILMRYFKFKKTRKIYTYDKGGIKR